VTEVGQIGALLRREGLFSSHLSNWRLQRSRGLLDSSASKKRAPKPSDHNAVRVNQQNFHLTMICGPALNCLSQVIISQGVGTEGVLAQSAGPG
jgi:hypothetical protein